MMLLLRVVRRSLVFSSVVALAILIASPGRSSAQNVIVHLDSTAQTIRGFGAAYIEFWQPRLTAANVETAFGLGEDQLGLSILRLGISSNPNSWGNNLEAAQKAVEMGAIVFASPWNAPADLLKPKINPGDPDTVDVAKYAEYAQHLADFNSFMSSNGVDLHAISIQNEPDFAHDWTGWSSENMVTFLREHAPSIGARIMAPESFQFRKSFSDPILRDSLAAAHTDIIGGHIYGGGNSSYPLAESMGKEVWMTEYLLNLGTGNAGATPWDERTKQDQWDETIEMLRTVHASMKSNMNAYVWWYLKRYYSFLGDGQFRESDGLPTKRGYAFAQFAKFVRPGYVRVHTSGPIGRGYVRIFVTAYVDPETDRLVIVAINAEPEDKEINFVIDELRSATFKRYITSIDQSLEELADLEVTNSEFAVTLPTGTITTFVSEAISHTGVEKPGMPSGYDLRPNYPNPFNASTVIGFDVPEASTVRLEVYDVLGRSVASLVDGQVSAGRHEVRFDAADLPSGVYFYALQAGNATTTRRMLLVR